MSYRLFPLALAVLLARSSHAQISKPVLSELLPNSIAPGGSSFTLVAMGFSFLPGATVFWNNTPLVTTFFGSSQLQAQVPAPLTAVPSTVPVYVQNPDGGFSALLPFTITQPSLLITSASSLPPGSQSVAYSYRFTAVAGTPTYQWAIAGSVPPGLTLDATGVLSGVPTTSGPFAFSVRVRDSLGAEAVKDFTLTILPTPLSISTTTLFNGTVGVAYTQAFSATGGRAPYRWSLTGNAGGLSLDPTNGTLTGTPRSTGSFAFTVQVTDSIAMTASKNFTLVVETPRLNILSTSPLPAGTAGTSYSYTFAAVGGTSPYTWSIFSGTAGGLSLNPSTGVLTDVPPNPGTFTFTIQVRDAGGQTATRPFTLSIQPRPLTFLTATQLPPGTVASPLSLEIAATGGVPPYIWSATGLPEGLAIDPSTGVIAGAPTASGLFLVAIRVTDQSRASVVDLFRLPVNLPTVPEFRLSGLPNTVNAAAQLPLSLSTNSVFPLALTGQLVLTFSPDNGPGDSTIQFSSGGRSLDFQIPAESTTISLPPVELQTGTVAGTIRISVRLLTGGADITPTPPPSFMARVERAAPQIRTARMSRSGATLTVEISGFTTAREVTQAVFRFRAGPGNSLRVSEVTVPVEDLFNRYFQDPASARFGSQFVFRQPFTVEGDANAVTAESVTLTNRVGTATLNIAQ